MVILYLGPNTIMPLASIVAAIVGFILIFWRFIIKSIQNIFKALFRRNQNSSTADEAPITDHKSER